MKTFGKTFAKSCISAAAIAAIIGFAGAASAQSSPVFAQGNQLQSAATPPWMQDDGSSSDHPIHMPGDVSGDALNSQYRDAIPAAPPNGFPAPYRIR
jgi:hypothetical protein